MTAARFCLQQEASFKLLELTGIGYPQPEEQRPVERPSWVPRVDLLHVSKTKALVLRSEKYQTATHLSHNVSTDTTYAGLLEIEGSIIDSVGAGSDIWHPWKVVTGNPGFSNLSEELTVISKLLNLAEWRCAEVNRFDAEQGYTLKRQNPIWRTLFQDSREMFNVETTYFEKSFNKMDEAIRAIRPLIAPEYERDEIDMLTLGHEFMSLMTVIYPILGRRICNTQRGCIGIIPPNSQTRDRICVFSGAPTPFLLRPSVDLCPDGSQRTAYELVGACYINGIMQGELKDVELDREMICLV